MGRRLHALQVKIFNVKLVKILLTITSACFLLVALAVIYVSVSISSNVYAAIAFGNNVTNLAYGLVTIGVIIFFLAFMGCATARKHSSKLTAAYSFLLLMVIIAHGVVVGIMQSIVIMPLPQNCVQMDNGTNTAPIALDGLGLVQPFQARSSCTAVGKDFLGPAMYAAWQRMWAVLDLTEKEYVAQFKGNAASNKVKAAEYKAYLQMHDDILALSNTSGISCCGFGAPNGCAQSKTPNPFFPPAFNPNLKAGIATQYCFAQDRRNYTYSGGLAYPRDAGLYCRMVLDRTSIPYRMANPYNFEQCSTGTGGVNNKGICPCTCDVDICGPYGTQLNTPLATFQYSHFDFAIGGCDLNGRNPVIPNKKQFGCARAMRLYFSNLLLPYISGAFAAFAFELLALVFGVCYFFVEESEPDADAELATGKKGIRSSAALASPSLGADDDDDDAGMTSNPLSSGAGGSSRSTRSSSGSTGARPASRRGGARGGRRGRGGRGGRRGGRGGRGGRAARGRTKKARAGSAQEAHHQL